MVIVFFKILPSAAGRRKGPKFTSGCMAAVRCRKSHSLILRSKAVNDFVKIAIQYAVNFMEYLNRRKSLPFEIQAFTSVETLTAYAEKNPVEILLISDRAMCREIQALKIGTVVILSEERPDPARKGFPAVYKYQAQDQLLREVMACYGEAPDLTPLVSLAARRNTEILGVYSPLHRCLKTSIALTLGQILAQDKAVLYLNLEEYSGFAKEAPNSPLSRSRMIEQEETPPAKRTGISPYSEISARHIPERAAATASSVNRAILCGVSPCSSILRN